MEKVFDELLRNSPQAEFNGLLADALFSNDPLRRARQDIFAEQQRKRWRNDDSARTDLRRHVTFTKHGGVWHFSVWRKSITGRKLTDIKADAAMPAVFANELAQLVTEILGDSLASGRWALCCPPKRRHLQRNFASVMGAIVARKLGVRWYEDVALCHTRQRIGARFELALLPAEPNLICVDDFVTTGSTFHAMNELLRENGKNVLFFSGVNNNR